MTTNLPPQLQHMLKVVVGQPWPESDESGVREIGRAWSTFSDAITQILNDLKDSAGALPPHMRGATADAYAKWAGSTMQDQLNQLKQSADELSKMMINAAADIQKAKIMIIFQLVLLVATIAALIASLFGAFAIPGVIATARAIITALLQALALNLAMTFGMDFLIQLGQILNNQRDGFDLKSLGASALSGAVGGLLFGLGSVAGSFLRNGIAKLITNNLDAAIANPLAKISGAVVEAGVQAPLAVVGSVITEAATGQRISVTAGMFTSAFLGSLNGGGHGGGGDHGGGDHSGGDHSGGGAGGGDHSADHQGGGGLDGNHAGGGNAGGNHQGDGNSGVDNRGGNNSGVNHGAGNNDVNHSAGNASSDRQVGNNSGPNQSSSGNPNFDHLGSGNQNPDHVAGNNSGLNNPSDGHSGGVSPDLSGFTLDHSGTGDTGSRGATGVTRSGNSANDHGSANTSGSLTDNYSATDGTTPGAKESTPTVNKENANSGSPTNIAGYEGAPGGVSGSHSGDSSANTGGAATGGGRPSTNSGAKDPSTSNAGSSESNSGSSAGSASRGAGNTGPNKSTGASTDAATAPQGFKDTSSGANAPGHTSTSNTGNASASHVDTSSHLSSSGTTAHQDSSTGNNVASTSHSDSSSTNHPTENSPAPTHSDGSNTGNSAARTDNASSPPNTPTLTGGQHSSTQAPPTHASPTETPASNSPVSHTGDGQVTTATPKNEPTASTPQPSRQNTTSQPSHQDTSTVASGVTGSPTPVRDTSLNTGAGTVHSDGPPIVSSGDRSPTSPVVVDTSHDVSNPAANDARPVENSPSPTNAAPPAKIDSSSAAPPSARPATVDTGGRAPANTGDSRPVTSSAPPVKTADVAPVKTNVAPVKTEATTGTGNDRSGSGNVDTPGTGNSGSGTPPKSPSFDTSAGQTAPRTDNSGDRGGTSESGGQAKPIQQSDIPQSNSASTSKAPGISESAPPPPPTTRDPQTQTGGSAPAPRTDQPTPGTRGGQSANPDVPRGDTRTVGGQGSPGTRGGAPFEVPKESGNAHDSQPATVGGGAASKNDNKSAQNPQNTPVLVAVHGVEPAHGKPDTTTSSKGSEGGSPHPDNQPPKGPDNRTPPEDPNRAPSADNIREIYDAQQAQVDLQLAALRGAADTPTVKTELRSGDGAITVNVEHFGSTHDPEWPIKEQALQGALDRLANSGHRLPGPLEISVSKPGTTGVLTQMMHLQHPDGTPHWHMFLGPKLLVRNDLKLGTEHQVRGGIGEKPGRGVAHRVADQAENAAKKAQPFRRFGIGSKSTTSRAYDVGLIEAVIVHEFGHAMHTAHDPTYFQQIQHQRQTGAGHAGPAMSSLDVSHYATSNGLEFVAETFTAHVYGEDLPKDVLTEYTALGGSPLSRPPHGDQVLGGSGSGQHQAPATKITYDSRAGASGGRAPAAPRPLAERGGDSTPDHGGNKSTVDGQSISAPVERPATSSSGPSHGTDTSTGTPAEHSSGTDKAAEQNQPSSHGDAPSPRSTAERIASDRPDPALGESGTSRLHDFLGGGGDRGAKNVDPTGSASAGRGDRTSVAGSSGEHQPPAEKITSGARADGPNDQQAHVLQRHGAETVPVGGVDQRSSFINALAATLHPDSTVGRASVVDQVHNDTSVHPTLDDLAAAAGARVHVLGVDGKFTSYGHVTGIPVHVVEVRSGGDTRYLATDQTVHIGLADVAYPGPTKLEVAGAQQTVHRGEFEIETVAGQHYVRVYTAVVHPEKIDVTDPAHPQSRYKDVQQDPETGKVAVSPGGNAQLYAGIGRPLRALQWLDKYERTMSGQPKSEGSEGARSPVLRSFLVPLDVVEHITGETKLQGSAHADATRDTYNVDQSGEPNQFAIGGPHLDELIKNAEPGSLISYSADPKASHDHAENAGRHLPTADLRGRLGLRPDFRSDVLGKAYDPWFSWAKEPDGSWTFDGFRNDPQRLHAIATDLREHHVTWQQTRQDPARRTPEALIERDAESIPGPDGSMPVQSGHHDGSYPERVARLNQFLNEVGPTAGNVERVKTAVLSAASDALRAHLDEVGAPKVDLAGFQTALREHVVPDAVREAAKQQDSLKELNGNRIRTAARLAEVVADGFPATRAKPKGTPFADKVITPLVDAFVKQVRQDPRLGLLTEASRAHVADALAERATQAFTHEFRNLDGLESFAGGKGNKSGWLSGARLNEFAQRAIAGLTTDAAPHTSPRIDPARVSDVAAHSVLDKVVTGALDAFTRKDLLHSGPDQLKAVVRDEVLPKLSSDLGNALRDHPAVALVDEGFRATMAGAVSDAARARAERALDDFVFHPVDPAKVDDFMANVPEIATQAEIAAVVSADANRIKLDFNTRAEGEQPFANDFHRWKTESPDANRHANEAGNELSGLINSDVRTPKAVLDALIQKFPELDRKFDEVATEPQSTPFRQAGAKGAYTFYEHAQMVLGQYFKLTEADRNSGERFVPVDAVAKAILFHDIEKNNAKNQFGAGKGQHDREPEHKLAVQMMDRHRGLWANDREFQAVRAIVDSDPLGFYVRGKITADAAFRFVDDLAQRIGERDQAKTGRPVDGENVRKLFDEFHQYYQADFSSYTAHSRFVDREGNTRQGPNSFTHRFEAGADGVRFDSGGRHFQYASGSIAESKMRQLSEMFSNPETIQQHRERINTADRQDHVPTAAPSESRLDAGGRAGNAHGETVGASSGHGSPTAGQGRSRLVLPQPPRGVSADDRLAGDLAGASTRDSGAGRSHGDAALSRDGGPGTGNGDFGVFSRADDPQQGASGHGTSQAQSHQNHDAGTGTVLTGELKHGGGQIRFRPDDVVQSAVYSKPDGMQRMIGVSFVRKGTDLNQIRKWTESADELGHTWKTLSGERVWHALGTGRNRARLDPVWSADYRDGGSGPIILDAHGKTPTDGQPDRVRVVLHKGTITADGEVLKADTSVYVDGGAYAHIVHNSSIFQRVYRDNPSSSFGATTCWIGSNRVSSDFMATMRLLGYRNGAHFSRGRLQLIPETILDGKAGDLSVADNKGWVTYRPDSVVPEVRYDTIYTSAEEQAIRSSESQPARSIFATSSIDRADEPAVSSGNSGDTHSRTEAGGDAALAQTSASHAPEPAPQADHALASQHTVDAPSQSGAEPAGGDHVQPQLGGSHVDPPVEQSHVDSHVEQQVVQPQVADPAALVAQARLARPKVEGTIDGTAVRNAILTGLAGSKADTEVLRKFVEQAYSDEKLTENFLPALDGGHVEDFGTQAGKGGPQVTVEVVGLTAHGEQRESVANFDFSHSNKSGEHNSSSTAPPASGGALSVQIPTPHVLVRLVAAGAVNTKKSSLAPATEHETATKVIESDRPALTGGHHIDYKVTVRLPGRAPATEVPARSDATLTWPRQEIGPEVSAQERIRPDQIEHTEFAPLGDIYQRVQDELGGPFQVNDRAAKDFRYWLSSLSNEGPALFSGMRVSKSFMFADRSHSTEVSVMLGHDLTFERLPRTDAKVEHTDKTSATNTSAHSNTRRQGGKAGVVGGDITGVTGLLVGPIGSRTKSTDNASGITDKHELESVRKYEGPLDKQQVKLTFLVQVGDEQREVPHTESTQHGTGVGGAPVDPAKVKSYAPKSLVKVPGTATLWGRPRPAASHSGVDHGHSGGESGPSTQSEHAVAESSGSAQARPEPPASGPEDAPDHVWAAYRIPDETAQRIAGAVLHRLAATDLLPARAVPRLNDWFAKYLQANAREAAGGGDGVRVPLSEFQHGAPDVFVRGVLHRSEAEDLGSPAGETLGGKIGASRGHNNDLTKGTDSSAGFLGTGYKYDAWGSSWPEGEATYGWGNNRDAAVSQGFGHEQPLPAAKIRQYSYPTDFEVRIGGRWAEPNAPAEWKVLPEPKVQGQALPAYFAEHTSVLTGHVEVAVPEHGGVKFEAEPTPPGRDHGEPVPQWRAGTPPLPEREGHLPAGYELASLKPTRELSTTTAAMLGTPKSGRWVDWLKRPFIGRRPPEVDQRGSWLAQHDGGPRNEHNAARDLLGSFTSPAARMARFDRAVQYKDSVRLESHNHGGLVGSRDLVAQLDLTTRLGNPRIVGRDDAHSFTRTEHVKNELGTGKGTSKGLRFYFETYVFIPVKDQIVGPYFTTNAEHTRSEHSGITDGAKTTTTSSHIERGYLVSYDATHTVHTAARRNWQDLLGLGHRGSAAGDKTKWIAERKAVQVWVPASEIHNVGRLTEHDIARLDTGEADRYRENHPAEQTPTREPDPAQTQGPAEHAASVQDTHIMQAQPESLASPPRPPDTVGHGTGTVEFHRLDVGQELLAQVSQRLTQWSRQLGLGDPAVRFPDSTVVKLAKLNDRLANDVLGPTMNKRGSGGPLEAMLNGGWPILLVGDTAFGKVEQLVVLHANLGEGTHHQTIPEHTLTVSHETTPGDIQQKKSGWAARITAGFTTYNGTGHDWRIWGFYGPTLAHNSMRGHEFANQYKHTVTGTTKTQAEQFVHPLNIKMEVQSYARPGAYTKWLPTPLVPRTVDRTWVADRAGNGPALGPEFEIAGAARSTVATADTIRTDGSTARPLAHEPHSLKAWQREQGMPLGLSADTKVQVHPFTAPKLHAALTTITRDPARNNPRPQLHPNANYRLLTAVTPAKWRSHLRDAMARGGYVIDSIGDNLLDKVRIEADFTNRKLLKVLDGPLTSTDTHTQQPKLVSEKTTSVGVEWFNDIRGPIIQDANYRSRVVFVNLDRNLASWKDSREQGFSSTKDISGTRDSAAGDGSRYLVSVTPRWRVTPTYRGKKTPAAWNRTIRTGADEPIQLEVDQKGLEQLGLRVPKGKGKAVATDPGQGSSRDQRVVASVENLAESHPQDVSSRVVTPPVHESPVGPSSHESPAGASSAAHGKAPDRSALTDFLNPQRTTETKAEPQPPPMVKPAETATTAADSSSREHHIDAAEPAAQYEAARNAAPVRLVTADGQRALFDGRRFTAGGQSHVEATVRLRFNRGDGVSDQAAKELFDSLRAGIAEHVNNAEFPGGNLDHGADGSEHAGDAYLPGAYLAGDRFGVRVEQDDQNPHLVVDLTADHAAEMRLDQWPTDRPVGDYVGQIVRQLGVPAEDHGHAVADAPMSAHDLSVIGGILEGNLPVLGDSHLLDENPARSLGYDVGVYNSARDNAKVFSVSDSLTSPFHNFGGDIRFDGRRFEVGGDKIVEATVRVGIKPIEGAGDREIHQVWQRLVHAANEGINSRRLEIPDGELKGERFVLRVELDNSNPHLPVELTGDPRFRTNGTSWATGRSGAVYLSEVLHRLGLDDEYYGHAALPAQVRQDMAEGKMPKVMNDWGNEIYQGEAGKIYHGYADGTSVMGAYKTDGLDHLPTEVRDRHLTRIGRIISGHLAAPVKTAPVKTVTHEPTGDRAPLQSPPILRTIKRLVQPFPPAYKRTYTKDEIVKHAELLGITPDRFSRFARRHLDSDPTELAGLVKQFGEPDANRVVSLAELIDRMPRDLPALAHDMGLSPRSLFELAAHLGEHPQRFVVFGKQLAELAGDPMRADPLSGKELADGLRAKLASYGVRTENDLGWLVGLAHQLGWHPHDLELLQSFNEHRLVTLELLHDLPAGFVNDRLNRVRDAERHADDPVALARDLGLPSGNVVHLVAAGLKVDRPADLVAFRTEFAAIDRGRPGAAPTSRAGAELEAARIVHEFNSRLSDRGIRPDHYVALSRRLGFPATDLAALLPGKHFRRLVSQFIDELPGARVDDLAAIYARVLAQGRDPNLARLTGMSPGERELNLVRLSAEERDLATRFLAVFDGFDGRRPGDFLLESSRADIAPLVDSLRELNPDERPPGYEEIGTHTQDGSPHESPIQPGGEILSHLPRNDYRSDEVAEWSSKLDIEEEEFQRLVGFPWFDPAAVVALAQRMKTPDRMMPAFNEMVLAFSEKLGRVPTDLPQLAHRLGLADPHDLLTVAAGLGVDPRHLLWLRDPFAKLGTRIGPHEDGRLTPDVFVQHLKSYAAAHKARTDQQRAYLFWVFSRAMLGQAEHSREADWWLSHWWAEQFRMPAAAIHDDLLTAPWLDHGRAADLLTALGRAPHEFVHLRQFSRDIGRLPDDIPQLAEQLGVRDPDKLYRIAFSLGAEPRQLLPHKDVFATLNGPERGDGPLITAVTSINSRIDAVMQSTRLPRWTAFEFLADRNPAPHEVADRSWMHREAARWRAERAGVPAEQDERTSAAVAVLRRQPWFYPSHYRRLLEELGGEHATDILRLSTEIRRVPTDIAPLANSIRAIRLSPHELLSVASELHVDPRDVVAFVDSKYVVGGKHGAAGQIAGGHVRDAVIEQYPQWAANQRERLGLTHEDSLWEIYQKLRETGKTFAHLDAMTPEAAARFVHEARYGVGSSRQGPHGAGLPPVVGGTTRSQRSGEAAAAQGTSGARGVAGESSTAGGPRTGSSAAHPPLLRQNADQQALRSVAAEPPPRDGVVQSLAAVIHGESAPPHVAPDRPAVSLESFNNDPHAAAEYMNRYYPDVLAVNQRNFNDDVPGYQTNCAASVVQTHNAIIFRRAFPAPPSDGPVPTEALERSFGSTYSLMPGGFDGVSEHMRNQPPSTQGSVLVNAAADGVGHAFNVQLNPETHTVDYIDGTIGLPARLGPNGGPVWFMRHPSDASGEPVPLPAVDGSGRQSSGQPDERNADPRNDRRPDMIGMFNRSSSYGFNNTREIRTTQWANSGRSTYSSVMYETEDGDLISLGTAQSTRSARHGSEHAEDVAIRTIEDNLSMFSSTRTNRLVINLTKSPCTSTSRNGLPITTNKAVGCAEELMRLVRYGIEDRDGRRYTFTLNITARGLYAPRVEYGRDRDGRPIYWSNSDVLAASQAAIDAMNATGRISVQGDVRSESSSSRYGIS